MNKSLVLVAGGSGMRMGSALPKQFILIKDKPVFIYAVEVFLKAFADINVILVMPESYIEYAKTCINDFQMASYDFKLVPGGSTRFESVKNGLALVPENHIVFVHDAVRCLVSIDLIIRCAESCLKKGSAIPVIPVKDSIRKIMVDGSSKTVDRSSMMIVQTPQAFFSNDIKGAFKLNFQDSFTDEATVFEAAGYDINLVEGEERNIKLTYPADIEFATWALTTR